MVLTLDEILQQLDGDIDAGLQEAMKIVAEMRATIPPGDPDDGPAEIHSQLIDARKAVDRIEYITARVSRLSAKAHAAERELRYQVEDAEATAITGKHTTTEYATAKEKNANLLLATVEQRIALRKAERRTALLQECTEFCRTAHSGANGARRDLETRTRLISLQTSLEK